MSVEAFAMAGADYMECAINIYALEQRFKQPPPPQAKSKTEQSLSPQVDKSHTNSLSLDIIGREILAWFDSTTWLCSRINHVSVLCMRPFLLLA